MKDWLIRTKNNHILGPISKAKLIDLYKNGSIKSDDEVSSGNGYWFFIREKELVEKYLIGSQAQSFNPVQEAPNILTKVQEEDIELTLDEGSEQLMPDAEDLAYPDLAGDDLSEEEVSETIEMLEDDLEYPDIEDSISAPSLVEKKSELIEENVFDIRPEEKIEPIKEEKIANFQDFDDSKKEEYFDSLKPKRENVDLVAPIHAKDIKKNKEKYLPPELPPKVAKNNILTLNVLLSLVFVFLILLGVAIYFRGSILKMIKSASHFNVIEKVYAQEDLFVQKKKSGGQNTFLINL